MADVSNRLDIKTTYCADEVHSTPDILRGPIGADHLSGIVLGLAPGAVSVMLCGPPAMMKTTADALLSLGVPITNVH